ERLFERKVSLPRVIWKWEYTHQIGEIKVARRVGRYAIPTGKDEYREGEGLLYALLFENTGYISGPREFTADKLIRIVDALTAEVAEGSALDQNTNDTFE
ncbi:MAG: hypothetical protein DRP09_14515, partial [Candidatus Thorarchaeota archaeon]